jgi:hypothetical protein
MRLYSDDLYGRISGLRGEALEALNAVTRANLDMTSDQVGRLVVTMQQVANQLGSVQALLAHDLAARTPVAA